MILTYSSNRPVYASNIILIHPLVFGIMEISNSVASLDLCVEEDELILLLVAGIFLKQSMRSSMNLMRAYQTL